MDLQQDIAATAIDPIHKDSIHANDTNSLAPTDTNTGYASTTTSHSALVDDNDFYRQYFRRESLRPSKTPHQSAIAEAATARSQLTKKEAQKLDERLSTLICGRVPRMTVTTAMPKLQKGTGFLVGSPDEIAAALAAGADVHLGVTENSPTNQDALWYEIANKKRPDVADLLLQYGARLDATKLTGCSYYGANVGILRVLLEYGADPNKWAHLGVSPLCTAAHYGNPAGARLLMAYGASPNALNPRTQKGTALATACFKLNVDTVASLLQYGANPDTEGYDHLNPAQAAIETVKRMSAANANNGRDRLVPILRFLKESGAKEEEIDVYLDPFSEATRSLIHPWDYGGHLKKVRNGRSVDMGRRYYGNGNGNGHGVNRRMDTDRESVVPSEFGGSTRGLLVQ
jgi:Ankyrin repeats (3 copies)